jgi:hypothetical protein
MALPKNHETERGLALRKIVEAASECEYFGWPNPTVDDFRAFGELIWLFTCLDFVLRTIAEVMDHSDMLSAPYKGKVQNLTIKKTSDAILSSSIWTGPNCIAFARIDELRRLRNLVAHFVAKRFVHENAFIFMTRSGADYEQVYGVKPQANAMLYGILDAPVIGGVLPEIAALLR